MVRCDMTAVSGNTLLQLQSPNELNVLFTSTRAPSRRYAAYSVALYSDRMLETKDAISPL
jgi:hypothetical protein